MIRLRLKPDLPPLADEVTLVLVESGVDPDKGRYNKHVVNLVLDWRSLRIVRKDLVLRLKKLRDNDKSLKKITRLRLVK